MNKGKISKALLEVWDWKEESYKEIADLPVYKAINKRIDTSIKTTKKLGFKVLKGNKQNVTLKKV